MGSTGSINELDIIPIGGIVETTITKSGSSSSISEGGQGSKSTTTVNSSSDSSGKKITSTTTVITSSTSSLSSQIAGKQTVVGEIVNSNDDDCSDCDCDSCDCADEEVEIHSHDCDKQLKKLNNDNDQLTKQLKSSNSIISTLTEEKSWVLDELKGCTEEYTCVTRDFEKISIEIKTVKKKLQVSLDESVKLKTQLIAASADAQKWQTRSDSLDIELKKTKDINVQLTVTVNECTTTITSLRTTVNDMTIKNNKCGADADEWKRKWEAENAKVIKYEKTIKEWETSNADLKSKNAKLTDDLSSCQDVNHQNDIEINRLKNTVTDLKKQLSNCTVDLGNCNVSLKRALDDFDADQKKDHEEAIKCGKLEVQLGECSARKKDLEQNYESEKKLVIDCKNEIVTVRDECTKRSQKYDDDLANLKITSKASIDKCEASLKTERDSNAKIRIDVTNLQNRIVEFESKLTISINVSDDWQKKNKYCEDNSVTLRQTIETLRSNLADTNKNLSDSVANGNSLQSQLTSCKSSLEICTTNLSDTKNKLADRETTIINLNVQIGSLESSNNRCQGEVSKLRCDVNQYLDGAKAAEEKARQTVLEVLSILDVKKKSMSDFVDSHDITCNSRVEIKSI